MDTKRANAAIKTAQEVIKLTDHGENSHNGEVVYLNMLRIGTF